MRPDWSNGRVFVSQMRVRLESGSLLLKSSYIGNKGEYDEPFTSRVGLPFPSMTGPCQVTSKKVLIAIAEGDVENSLTDEIECRRGCSDERSDL